MDTASFSWDQLYANNLQLFALVTGLLSVALLIPVKYPRLQYFAWIFGFLTSAAYFFVFKDDWQLYGSAALQVWFVIASIAGAYIWRGQLFGNLRHVPGRSSSLLSRIFGAEGVPTAYAPRSYVLKVLGITALAAIPSYFVLSYLNDSAPDWDSLVLVGSMAAIWLQAKKYVQNWYLWIGVDLIAIPFYYSQANLGLALLYLAYLLMCLWGLRTWRGDAVRSSSEEGPVGGDCGGGDPEGEGEPVPPPPGVTLKEKASFFVEEQANLNPFAQIKPEFMSPIEIRQRFEPMYLVEPTHHPYHGIDPWSSPFHYEPRYDPPSGSGGEGGSGYGGESEPREVLYIGDLAPGEYAEVELDPRTGKMRLVNKGYQ